MVITCPECSAKYKLPGQKIRGRGAKITCPRCSHVFVIFSKDMQSDDGSAVDGEVEPRPARRRTMPGPAMPAPTPTAAPASAPAPAAPQVPGGLRAEDIFGTGEDMEPATPSAPPAGSPPPPKPGTTPPHPIPAVTQAEPPSGPQGLFDDREIEIQDSVDEPSEGALDAESLDFAGVGITTWKVKVSIGLVYDFSDIKTLRKYMQDGKITHDDQISYDGENWHRIGEPEEFEAYLIGIYRERRAEAKDTASPLDEADQVAAAAASPSDNGRSAASSSSSTLEETAPQDGIAVDLGQRPKRRRRRRAAMDDDEPRKILGMSVPVFAIVACVLVLGGGFAIWKFVISGGPTPGGAGDGVAGEGESDAEIERRRQEARERIDQKLEEQRKEIEEQENGTGDTGTSDATPVPVNGNDGRAVPVNGNGTADAGTVEDRLPERITPDPTPAPPDPTPPPVEEETPQETNGGNDGGAVVEETTAEDWFMLGDVQLSSGNCSGAIGPLQQAVSKAPGNTTYNYKLGLAYHRCGNDSAALGPLKIAAATYPDAQQIVDEIEGDGG